MNVIFPKTENFVITLGRSRLRAAHGQTDGTIRVHGEKDQGPTRQILPHLRTRNGERQLLVHPV